MAITDPVIERVAAVAVGALIILATRKMKGGVDVGAVTLWLTLAALAFSYSASAIQSDAGYSIFCLIVGLCFCVGAVKPAIRIARRFLALFFRRGG
jgi:ABC-type Co2+ transport system permease subunit